MERRSGAEQLLNPLELLIAEISEQLQAPDQLAGIEPEVEAGPRLSFLSSTLPLRSS